jgi:hypothetical protein
MGTSPLMKHSLAGIEQTLLTPKYLTLRMTLHTHGESFSSKLRTASSKTRQISHAFKGRTLSVQAAQADVAVKPKQSELSLPSFVNLRPL